MYRTRNMNKLSTQTFCLYIFIYENLQSTNIRLKEIKRKKMCHLHFSGTNKYKNNLKNHKFKLQHIIFQM